ncbi:hypothetical protein MC378_12315 [Polaribacter sp. MSW13]|uniref:HTTM-like domain-containing protein n=1 Tax=Polaribacter marinus TaxID=2916838 RepID=A0A9X1VPR8_9FLAO|nr:hypothetical protein [Polaribacter marinus]MCI2229953.1 hypothetical protein [Polaribacter marinus]
MGIKDCAILTSLIINFSVVLDASETLYRRNQYKNDSLLSFKSLSFLTKYNLIQKFFLIDNFIATNIFKLIIGFIGLFYFSPYILTIVLFLQLISFIRHKSANSAADQMQIIILFGITIFAYDVNSVVNQASIYFIAVQSTISYVTAGYHKITSPVWRSGNAILQVMGTDTYGHIPFRDFLFRNRLIVYLLAWGTILLDFFFFLALISPVIAMIFIALGTLFHIANAYFMGLNSFLYVFPASYPCILYTSIVIFNFLF